MLAVGLPSTQFIPQMLDKSFTVKIIKKTTYFSVGYRIIQVNVGELACSIMGVEVQLF